MTSAVFGNWAQLIPLLSVERLLRLACVRGSDMEGEGVMRIQSNEGKLTDWQRVFLQSKVNGAAYNGDALERHKWDWPKGTYFQRRFYRIKHIYKLR
jgi:hypothetical protein